MESANEEVTYAKVTEIIGKTGKFIVASNP